MVMTMNKALGGIHILIAAVVALYYLFGIFLGDGMDHSLWPVLNWFMAVATILSFYFAYTWKKGLGEDASTKDFISAKILYLGAALLVLWFFPSWFSEMVGNGNDAAMAIGEHFWSFVDPLFILVVCCVGCKLWNEG